MTNTILTPELASYCAQIVMQRGIKNLTPDVLGDVLQLALAQMDRAACTFLDKSHVRNAVEKSIYSDIMTTRCAQ